MDKLKSETASVQLCCEDGFTGKRNHRKLLLNGNSFKRRIIIVAYPIILIIHKKEKKEKDMMMVKRGRLIDFGHALNLTQTFSMNFFFFFSNAFGANHNFLLWLRMDFYFLCNEQISIYVVLVGE